MQKLPVYDGVQNSFKYLFVKEIHAKYFYTFRKHLFFHVFHAATPAVDGVLRKIVIVDLWVQ